MVIFSDSSLKYLLSSAILLGLINSAPVHAMHGEGTGEDTSHVVTSQKKKKSKNRKKSQATVLKGTTHSEIYEVVASNVTPFPPKVKDIIARYAETPSPQQMQAFVKSIFSGEKDTPNSETQEKYTRLKALEEFLAPYIPGPEASSYFKKAISMYVDLTKNKHEIFHDGRHVILPGVVTEDYGWNFPIVLRVHEKLLAFCSQGEDAKGKRLNIMDVGAGFGFDTMGMLMTRKATVIAMEKQQAQQRILDQTVRASIQRNLDPTFPLDRFRSIHADFLTFSIADGDKEAYHGANFNKLFHFFDPDQSGIAVDRADMLVKRDGCLFITNLTPTPGSEIDKFMAAQIAAGKACPGYLCYIQENEVLGDNTLGPGRIVEVREPNPKAGEGPAYFLQTFDERAEGRMFAVTRRVMHYHTRQTLASLLGKRFRIIDHMVLSPEETRGTT